ncbi:C1-like protein [Corchorus capsularis]|uniref:C1-like protein n=1 Tax=Corchorus capsularis TaxID=210143 RepID=A0A1R3KVF6_COCAP|nr:C1-like protein [Corchorus capsularis]
MQMQMQQSIPMMMIVKGHSSSSREKSKTVAKQLAEHLKYFLIDQDDLAPISPDDVNINSSFKILHQIASAQLSLKLGVVINLSPNSDQTHVNQLEDLSNTHKAQMILLDTTTSTSPFDVKSYIEKLSLGFPQAADYFRPHLKPNLAKTTSFRPSREKVPVPPKIFKHLHELGSFTKSTAEKLPCKSCQKQLLVSDPIYHCLESNCKDYVFHKACAESPGLEDARKNCPEFLRQAKPEYGFESDQKYRCKICEDNKNRSDGNECSDCLLQTIINGKLLPVLVLHESHPHPLNLIIVPISLNYEFRCCGCGGLGQTISYRCFDCNFNLHVRCVLLERNFKKDNKQTLRLNYGSLEENCWEKGECNVCYEELPPELWFYYNSATESKGHIFCLNPAADK